VFVHVRAPLSLLSLLSGWPVPIRRDTQPTEAQRLAADLYNMQNKERINEERALALQIRHGDGQ
jgi:hypothetical protein